MPDAYRQPAEPFPQPPDSTPDFEAIRRRRNRRLTFVALTGGLLVVAGVGASAFVLARDAKRTTDTAASALRTCLLRAPLDPGESPNLRVRRLQLAAMSRPEAERVTAGARVYPLECHTAAAAVLDAVKPAGDDAATKALAALAQELDKLGAVSADLSGVVEPALTALDRVAPGAINAAPEPLPPAPLTADALAKASLLSKEGTSLGHSFTEDNPGLSLPVLIDEKDLPEGPLMCTFDAARDATCRSLTELKAAQQHGLRLLGTSDPDARPLIFAGQRGAEGIFVTGSGTYVDRLYSYGGYAQKDGAAAILGWDPKAKKLVLSRKSADGPALRSTLSPNFRVGNYFYGSQILWDQILVRGILDNERRLFVLPLAEADNGTFALADVGTLPEPGLIREGEEDQPHLTGCRTEKMTVVRVRGEGSDFLTFRIGAQFSKPVSAPAFGLLGCHGTNATIVRVEHGRGSAPLLYHDLCSSAGCTRTTWASAALDRGSVDLKPLDEKRIGAVDVAGKLLVVWSAGERGGLRMRIGLPGAFDRAADTVLLDDHVKDGKPSPESTLLGFRVFSRETFAVVLVSTVAGLSAIHIDADGAARPWPIRHEIAKN